ncbi:MAG: septum formation initiator family protein [Ruminococcaceae bacterium]|nr:septum formation initiator family protein [Oscillospiraceae bacterium]
MNQVRLSIPVKLAIFLAFVFMIVTLVSVQIQYNTLEEEREKLVAQIEDVQIDIDELNSKLNTPFDEAYIIALAKEKLGYCRPDEIIFFNDLIN